jgi:hypothetical protein
VIRKAPFSGYSGAVLFLFALIFRAVRKPAGNKAKIAFRMRNELLLFRSQPRAACKSESRLPSEIFPKIKIFLVYIHFFPCFCPVKHHSVLGNEG